MSLDAKKLADLLSGPGIEQWLVVTGAGVSHASGIATFRGTDPEAVWRLHDVEMATYDYFQRDPVGHWNWYLERFRAVDGARPNPAHYALAALEKKAARRGGDLTLVTQNIDCLHEAAGSRNLIKVHGSSDRLRCTSPGCALAAPVGSLARKDVDLEPFQTSPGHDTLPRCPQCDELLRAHVLFFDEFYTEHRDYQFDRVQHAAESCDLALFIGTSFAVGITELVLREALARRRPVVSIDPGGQPVGYGLESVVRLLQPAEEILPRLCQELGVSL